MSCCNQCTGIEKLFDRKSAEKELKKYRRGKLHRPTRLLLEVLGTQNLKGLSLMDVGGGVGIIQLELFKKGIASATDVDASPGYISVAKEAAEADGVKNNINYHQGNFIDIAPSLETQDIVTLDKVICCFPEVENMLHQSLQKAHKYYALVFPRDHVPGRFFGWLGNLWFKISGTPFRFYLHPSTLVHSTITNHGFERIEYRTTAGWQVALYRKA